MSAAASSDSAAPPKSSVAIKRSKNGQVVARLRTSGLLVRSALTLFKDQRPLHLILAIGYYEGWSMTRPCGQCEKSASLSSAVVDLLKFLRSNCQLEHTLTSISHSHSSIRGPIKSRQCQTRTESCILASPASKIVIQGSRHGYRSADGR